MKAYLMTMHLLVPRSMSSAKVKVKYKGYVSQKIGRFGGIRVSQTHLVFFLEVVSKIDLLWSCGDVDSWFFFVEGIPKHFEVVEMIIMLRLFTH